jgi:SAM-dependent methyltransferase
MKLTATLANPTVHLDERQLRPAEAGCGFCGERDTRRALSIQRDPDVWLLKCPRCQVASASRMPTEETLERYYSDYFAEHQPQMAEEKVTMVGPQRLADHVFRVARRAHDPDEVRILDYGGGDGTIAAGVGRRMLELGSRSVSATIVDWNTDLADGGDKRIRMKHCEKLELLSGERFHVVLASGILEHVPYPRPLMEALFDMLRPGGVFYARTPYELPLMRLGRRLGARMEMGYPGHLHDMSRGFWNGVLGVTGRERDYRLVKSKPSIVATTFGSHFVRTGLAYALKAPAYVLGPAYGLVGGWEVFVQRLERGL